MDHPILLSGWKENVSTLSALSVKDDHDLVGSPLFGLVGPMVPDSDLAGAVLSLRYVARERSVVQGVIFGVNGQVIRFGIEGEPLGQSP